MAEHPTTEPRHDPLLGDVARREVAMALIEMPEGMRLPKEAIIELMMQAFIRGVSWQLGVDR